jgi:hypothetical protein
MPVDCKTIFFLPISGHHICFNGVCEANCDDKFPVCADDKLFVEGSMIAVFPIKYTAEFANPFYLTCTNCSTSAEVRQHDDNLGKGSNFCSANVRQMAPFNNDRVMLNFVDAHIFDFFTGRSIMSRFFLFFICLKQLNVL